MPKTTRRVAIAYRISNTFASILEHAEWDSEKDGETALKLVRRIRNGLGDRFDLTGAEIDVCVIALRGLVQTGSFDNDGPAVASSMTALYRRLLAASESLLRAQEAS